MVVGVEAVEALAMAIATLTTAGAEVAMAVVTTMALAATTIVDTVVADETTTAPVV